MGGGQTYASQWDTNRRRSLAATILPVVLYDNFEDRWVITDFAFKLDNRGNVSPQQAFQCFAVSKSGDPLAGGWNFYSVETDRRASSRPRRLTQ
jgi:hypothetical protein